MSDNRINSSIVALLTLSLETLTRQIEAGEAEALVVAIDATPNVIECEGAT